MVRKGRYGRWRGNEYELFSQNRCYFLRTDNPAERSNGFTDESSTKKFLIRPIEVSELEDAYEIIPYAMLQGHRFVIEEFDPKSHTINIVTNNPYVMKIIDVQPYGKDEYMLVVPVSEVAILEERIPILGFENSFPN